MRYTPSQRRTIRRVARRFLRSNAAAGQLPRADRVCLSASGADLLHSITAMRIVRDRERRGCFRRSRGSW